MDKNFAKSKTVISAFVGFAALLMSMYGIDFTESDQKIVLDFIDACIILGAFIGTVYGRVKAKGGLKLW